MSNIFGTSAAQNNQQGSENLFDTAANTPTANAGPNLFCGAQNNTSGGNLFGNNNNQNQSGTTPGLFQNLNNNNDNNNNQNQDQTGNTPSLFNNSSTTQNKPNLFQSSTTNTGRTGLFTNVNQNQNQTGQSTTSGLFNSATQNQTQNAGTTSLFGATQNNTTQQLHNTNSLFGTSSLFNTQPAQSQQQQQQPNLSGSLFHQPTTQVGSLGHTMSNDQLQRLQMGGVSTQPNEKSVKDQITTVWKKWNPNGDGMNPATTTLKTYLYNAVPKEYSPFFYPNAALGEDEQSWEEALSTRPLPPKVDGQEVSNLAYVPIMCKGFEAMGRRVETQAKIVEEMRVRLHEMNNSLSAAMDAHQQRITVRIAAAKRQHQVLSQRCLRLAVKVQVLRNRGYALDTAEEALRKTLIALEKQVMDPGFAGREDEIWARMVALRERTRWLEEEGKRVTAQVGEQSRQGQTAKSNGVPEEILAMTRKLLKDYDGQLQHLNKELVDVKKEYAEWEASQRRR